MCMYEPVGETSFGQISSMEYQIASTKNVNVAKQKLISQRVFVNLYIGLISFV